MLPPPPRPKTMMEKYKSLGYNLRASGDIGAPKVKAATPNRKAADFHSTSASSHLADLGEKVRRVAEGSWVAGVRTLDLRFSPERRC